MIGGARYEGRVPMARRNLSQLAASWPLWLLPLGTQCRKHARCVSQCPGVSWVCAPGVRSLWWYPAAKVTWGPVGGWLSTCCGTLHFCRFHGQTSYGQGEAWIWEWLIREVCYVLWHFYILRAILAFLMIFYLHVSDISLIFEGKENGFQFLSIASYLM